MFYLSRLHEYVFSTELQVPLPALTICSDTKFDKYSVKKANNQRPIDRNGLCDGLNSTGLNLPEIGNMMAFLCPLFRNDDSISFANYSNDNFNQHVDELSVKDALNHCITVNWDSKANYNCDQTMQKVVTESGLCYTFNHLPCSELYKNNV